ncbi:pyrimidine 5'-nucleotidase [Ancylobacter sp. A5.8]|uniref:pyrimidine 5'-nucleotidase n=1 Tax=Ancylobacter gelatini TaxID=2919920 RepID=UPI001F4E25AE|nr:pyrimidine 5'-nucleotidase [Ancylobacter gelatini]MCJ8143476.1 pyrimidine 5'-nucleotidase [Ancylobacter gelatini]
MSRIPTSRSPAPSSPAPVRIDPLDFSHVETWVFDLDNTLYPPGLDLWRQIDMNMRGYIANYLGLSLDEAFALQKGYYRKYGTSLRGLMIEHGMDPDDFLAAAHKIDLASLDAAPDLGLALGDLPGRKLVYTNGSRAHAEQVLGKLGISEHFADVHDIVAAEFHPKPQEPAYRRFLDMFEVDPTRSAMFEDLARNLEVPAMLGMKTVLVVPPALDVFPAGHQSVTGDPKTREDWENEGFDAAHVDHVTDDLTGFLTALRAPAR